MDYAGIEISKDGKKKTTVISEQIELRWTSESQLGKEIIAEAEVLWKNYVEEQRSINSNFVLYEYNGKELIEDIAAKTSHFICSEWVLIFYKKNLAGFFEYSMPPYSFCSHDIRLFGLYISPEYRRKGLGSAAFERILKSCKTQHMDISIYISLKNETAQLFLHKLFAMDSYEERIKAENLVNPNLEKKGMAFTYWTRFV